MTAVATRPQILRDMFITQEKNDAGIHGLRFYIRGKPWVVDIDDHLLFLKANAGDSEDPE
jgi:hypothetical protein